MKTKMKKINLLPRGYVQEQEMKRFWQVMIGLLILEVIGFTSFFIVLPNLENQTIAKQLSEVSAKVQDSRYIVVNQKAKALKEAELETKQWEEIYEEIKGEQFISKTLINALLAGASEEMSIHSITLYRDEETNNHQVVLEGVSDEALTIMGYNATLEKQFGVGLVESEFQWDEEQNTYPYSITINLSETNQKEEMIEEGGGQ